MVDRHGDVTGANCFASIASEGNVGDGLLLRTTATSIFPLTL